MDPGEYFDCGRARLHGLDDALVDEALQRGLAAGDDHFTLAATDLGLIFCRPSISFALVAPWDEVTMIRPRGESPSVLPIKWPGQGELRFTVSKRLAQNIFRRWLQLRMRANRQAREAVTDLQARRLSTGPVEIVGPRGVGGVDRGGPGGERAVWALDAETTGEPMMGPEPTAGLVGAAGEPTAGLVGAAGEPTAGLVGAAGEPTAVLADGQLGRVAVPLTDQSRSWVAFGVGVASTLVVLSTVITLVAVSLSLYRRAGGGVEADTAAQAVGPVGRTTVDHQRFLPDPASPEGPQLDGSIGGRSEFAAPAVTSPPADSSTPSDQQLLAIAPGDETAWTVATDSNDVQSPPGAVRCDSNYSGCVPDITDLPGADVDCLGAGDGPYFVDEEITVLGTDIHDLDTDGDGLACEPDQPVTSSD